MLPLEPGCRAGPTVLLGEPDPPRHEVRQRVASLEPEASLVVVLAGPLPTRMERRAPLTTRIRYMGQLVKATARTRLAAARVERAIRRAGAVEVRRVEIGAPEMGNALGIGRRRVWLPVEVVLAVARSTGGSTLLDRAVALSEQELGERLTLERARLLAPGTLMAELSAPEARDRWLLRLGDPRAQPSLLAREDPVERLQALEAPESVRRRLVSPDVRGEVGPLAWTLERKLTGRHPRRMTDALWEQCTGFLAALGSVPAPASEVPRSLVEEAAVLAPHVGSKEGSVLEEVAKRADEELHDVPRRWGHGDFWLKNLLIGGGRLRTVLDWDNASATAFAGLDLIHLVAMTDPTLRMLFPGDRCTRLAASLPRGEPRRLHAALEAAGVPTGRSRLAALVRAYWLTLAARKVSTHPDPRDRSDWLELNVLRPLAELGRLGTG